MRKVECTQIVKLATRSKKKKEKKKERKQRKPKDIDEMIYVADK